MTLSPVHTTITDLPSVCGHLTESAPLSRSTWFRVGGPADVLFKPEDITDLAHFLAEKNQDISHTVLGVGSNVLLRDGGVAGVVVRLGRAFAGIDVQDDGTIVCGAASLDINVAKAAAKAERAGLEFLSGIPGTIGGALRMNAGAYGSEIADVFVSAVVLDDTGKRHTLGKGDFGFGYRSCGISENWVFIEATLATIEGNESEIRQRMSDIQAARQISQPIRGRTGGSTFANPVDRKAWQLIDAAGCRGLRRGGAMVSEQHCNFLINMGDATAADLEGLGEDVRRRVKDTSNVELRWEIHRLGRTQGDASG